MIDIGDYRAQETLRNGAVATIRSLRADDRERIEAAVLELDRESIYTRLLSHRSLTEAALTRIMTVDPERGIAGRLLKHLAAIARKRGITALEADVLSENGAMLAVFAYRILVAGPFIPGHAAIAPKRC